MAEVWRLLNPKKREPLSDRLSKTLPYQLIEQEDTEVSYTFKTDQGIEYVVRYVYSNDYYFDDSTDIGDTEILEFQFMPINKGVATVKDDRVPETLAYSMRKVLEARKNAILYICDSSDGKQAARSRLFNNWYNDYTWDKIEKHDGKIKNPGTASSEYVSLIINVENPFAKNVVEAFSFIMESDK